MVTALVSLLVLLAAPSTVLAPDTVLTQARAQEAAGNDSEAVALLDGAVRKDPTWAMAQLELGRLLLKSGTSPEAAILHLDVARALNPENPRAHYFYALAVDEQGHRDEALRSLQVSLALREDFADAQYRLAGLLFTAEQYGPAAQAYQRFVDTHPEDVGARLQLASALARSGAVPQAEKVLRSLAAHPASKLLATRRLAELVEQQGRKAEAQALRDSLDPPRKQLRPLGPSHR